jgi:hypothetical protein
MGVLALRLGKDRYLPLLDLDRPVQVTRLFTTLADGQRKAIFHFCFRGRRGQGWQPIGRIEWDDLPPSRAGEPTLELRLALGRAGSLQLRLRERTSGAARSYLLQLPGVAPGAPLEASLQVVPTEAPPEPAPEAPRPNRPPEAEALPATHSPPRRPAASKRARRTWLTVGLALAAVLLLAAGAVLVIRLIPLRRTLAPEGPARAASPAATPRQPAPPVPSASSAEPDAPKPAEPPKPAAAARDVEPAQGPEPLSYRVRWGDTLWRITEQYYGNPHLYSLLAGENAIVDPNLIIPGTELRLPPRIDDRDRKR